MVNSFCTPTSACDLATPAQLCFLLSARLVGYHPILKISVWADYAV